MRKKIQYIVYGLCLALKMRICLLSSSEEEEREVDEDQNRDYEIPDIPIDGYNI